MNETPKIDSSSMGDPARHRTREELERILETLADAPREEGRVTLLERRGEGGLRELLSVALLTPAEGVPGDAWGRRAQPDDGCQVSVMQADIATAIANGQPLGLFGDNLFLELDLSAANLPAGSRVRVGAALLEVTSKPHTGCRKFKARFGQEALEFTLKPELKPRNLRGIHMRVIQAGEVRPGDPVTVCSRPRPGC